MNQNLAFALKQVMLRPVKLELLNTYRGLPVVYAATLQSVAEEAFTVKVTGYEIVCLTLEPATTLLSPLLEDPVRANVLACNLASGLATLGNFQYTSARVGDRMIARVAPQAPLAVELEAGGQTLTGQLADVSVTGLGLIVPLTEAAYLRPNLPVSVALTLPLEPATLLRLVGTVRSVKLDGTVNRIGIQFTPQTQPFVIHQYVRERQGEITRELKALYEQRITQSR
jgi:hypothetical protein